MTMFSNNILSKANIAYLLFFVTTAALPAESIISADIQAGGQLVWYFGDNEYFLYPGLDVRGDFSFNITSAFSLGICADFLIFQQSSYYNNAARAPFNGFSGGITAEWDILDGKGGKGFCPTIGADIGAGWYLYHTADHLFFMLKGRLNPAVYYGNFYLAVPLHFMFFPFGDFGFGFGINIGIGFQGYEK